MPYATRNPTAVACKCFGITCCENAMAVGNIGPRKIPSMTKPAELEAMVDVCHIIMIIPIVTIRYTSMVRFSPNVVVIWPSATLPIVIPALTINKIKKS
jgi:hypothetical protein